jgi:GrpB-like predicted nucleotidyltransferase (UPF0157 family)
MSPSPAVVVAPYDPSWPRTFAALRDRIAGPLACITTRIEHVGSTSVPGLAAKPVIDIDVVVADASQMARASSILATLGYTPIGDLGIPDRHAFLAQAELPRHNLYVALETSTALRNHLAIRDHLRAHPDAATAYGELKSRLAVEHPDDVDSYCTAKTRFLIGLLARCGFAREELHAIARVNGIDPLESGVP